ncbi:MAG: cupredoxin domain-containing protein [Gammaproteobacteria bacterium]
MSLELSSLTLLVALTAPMLAFAESPTVELVIHNQQFTPQELPLPVDTKIKLVVHNQDSLPAEFESYDLSREVVVPGHSSVTVFIGPLSPGRYNFFNDFNHAAQGWVVVAGPATHPAH